MKAVQLRMARAAVGWGVRELAEKAGVTANTVTRIENGADAKQSTIEALQRALEAAGVEFTNGDQPGVRLKRHHDAKALDDHIEHLESRVADLKSTAAGKPSPATGMAMLRRGRAKSDLAKAKNKRAKASK